MARAQWTDGNHKVIQDSRWLRPRETGIPVETASIAHLPYA